MTTVEKFRHVLSQAGYLPFYLAYGNGNQARDNWHRDAHSLTGSLRLLVELLLLKKRVDAAAAIDLLGSDVYELLVSEGLLLDEDEHTRTDNLVLLCFNSVLFFCEASMNPQVYFGNDSIALGIYQTPLLSGKTIDLCAGSAIQSLVAAQTCDFSQAVEINPRAAKVAAFNVQLNHMQHKVQVTNMALEEFAAVTQEQYDLVTFNPPLLPVPSPLFYPFVGDGGEDGLDVTRRILELYIPKLTPRGSVEFIGCGLGLDGHPSFVDTLQPIFEAHGLSCNVHLFGVGKLAKGDGAYESTLVTTAVQNGISLELCHQVYELHHQKMKANEMYCFFVKAYRAPGGRPTVSVVRNTNTYLNWFVS